MDKLGNVGFRWSGWGGWSRCSSGIYSWDLYVLGRRGEKEEMGLDRIGVDSVFYLSTVPELCWMR